MEKERKGDSDEATVSDHVPVAVIEIENVVEDDMVPDNVAEALALAVEECVGEPVREPKDVVVICGDAVPSPNVSVGDVVTLEVRTVENEPRMLTDGLVDGEGEDEDDFETAVLNVDELETVTDDDARGDNDSVADGEELGDTLVGEEIDIDIRDEKLCSGELDGAVDLDMSSDREAVPECDAKRDDPLDTEGDAVSVMPAERD